LVLQPEVLSEIMLHDDGAAVQSRYIQNVAHYPPHKNSTAEYLSIGEKKYEKLKEELKKAKHFIFMEYLSFRKELCGTVYWRYWWRKQKMG